MPDTLATFPFVTVRLACRRCSRAGLYRLARLAAKYGADAEMESVLAMLAGDCIDWRPRHPYKPRCGAFFADLGRRPPDEPPSGAPSLRIIPGGRQSAAE